MGKESKSKGCLGWFLVIVILALVVGAVVYAIKQKMDHSDDDKAAPVPGPPGAIDKKYADALKIAMQFFDVQKCTFSLPSFSLYLLLCLRIWLFSFFEIASSEDTLSHMEPRFGVT